MTATKFNCIKNEILVNIELYPDLTIYSSQLVKNKMGLAVDRTV